MKRLLLIALAVILCYFTAESVSAVETEGTCGSAAAWAYDETSATLTITGSGAIDIRQHAPWSDLKYQIQVLVISEGITSTGSSAFRGLTQLHTVILPTSLHTVGYDAFNGCYMLSNINLENISRIESGAFSGCSGLSQLTVPLGVTEIGSRAFQSCKGLKQITFHSNVTTLGSYAFAGCNGLTSVTIPDSVTELGDSAFSSCYYLSQITLSRNQTAIAGNTFQSCSSLQRIVIPDSVTRIDVNAFSGCTALSYVEIGSGVSSINTTSFNNCPALQSFTVSSSNPWLSTDRGVLYDKGKTRLLLMPEGFSGAYTVVSGTTSIGLNACDECKGLTSVIIPGSVKTIEKYAFAHCQLSQVTFSDGLQTIGHAAFTDNPLSSVVFPATLQKIGGQAFSRCFQLREITFTSDTPKIDDMAFAQVEATVYYPANYPAWNDAQKLYGGILHWISVGECNQNSHNIVTIKGTAPTCSEEGLSDGQKCVKCKQILKKQTVLPAAGHKFGAWNVKTPATEQMEGVAERSCSVCHKTEEKTIPPGGEPETTTATEATRPAVPEQTQAATDKEDTSAVAQTKPQEQTPESTEEIPSDAAITDPTEAVQKEDGASKPEAVQAEEDLNENSEVMQPGDQIQKDVETAESDSIVPWALLAVTVCALGAGGVMLVRRKKK